MAKKALIVIDVQQGLFATQPAPFEAAQIIERINALARRARAANTSVLWVQHENDGALRFQSPGWQLDAGLDVHASDVLVRKKTPDAFHGTDLGEVLERLGIDSLAVAGYASEFCVDATVRRAAALGYPVEVVADAHTTHDKAHASAAMIRTHHNATLSNITSFGPKISAVPSDELGFA
ncbi:isochorismatase family protein [Acidovorax sp. CCYZU-2555]|uniref:isochorismatase family protein n=1 Tax=Acidovorax sp. CCYZU-2555 TaxID=2835042 RepID=UPI001BCB5237|nr:isochorismatase family protein [Acidovorax sp. CCYZU-2555]MBS7780069.1 isochorismatase family protein [Acidovorax sp. CCYZU-2555]